MSLLWIDGFNHILLDKGVVEGGSGVTKAISPGNGRRGTPSLRFSSPGSGSSNPYSFYLPAAYGTEVSNGNYFTSNSCIVGFAFRASGIGSFLSNAMGAFFPEGAVTSLFPRCRSFLLTVQSPSNHYDIGEYGVGANNVAGDQIGSLWWSQIVFTIESSGRIVAWKGDYAATSPDAGQVAIGVTDRSLSPNTWYFLEFKVVVGPVAGSVQVRINGDLSMNLSGVDTYTDPIPEHSLPYHDPPPIDDDDPATGWGRVCLGKLTGGGPGGVDAGSTIWDFDDLYIAVGDGSGLTDFWGDHGMMTRRVVGDGATLQMTPFPAAPTTHFDKVDDDPVSDGDTTYVEEDTTGEIDTFEAEDAVSSDPIEAVQVNVLARRSGDGGAFVAPVLRSGGSNFAGPAKPVGAAYEWVSGIWVVDPFDSGPISSSDWNAMQIGAKKEI